ncbi:LA_2272 family surface repeat-containing protein [Tenacibaculum sp. TC6]|uniref:LA_2272 family surface repeat-containing protein n=1 Tax=Tenacibaculum sp. TC6 TaxID=3423223 RepID=UPI003D35B768
MKNILLLFLSLSFGVIIAQQRKLRTPLWTTHSKNTDIVGISFGILPKTVFNDSTLTRTYGIRLEIPGLGVLLPLIPKSPLSTSDEEHENELNFEPSEIVYGVNLSSGSTSEILVNGVSGAFIGQHFIKMNGIAISGIGNIIEKQNGAALSILGNNCYTINGISGGILGNYAKKLNGVQLGAFNLASLAKGVQIGIQNNNTKKPFSIRGTQLGVLNYASDVHGIQIGLFNSSSSLKGIQIGLWNKNNKRNLPFINWCF